MITKHLNQRELIAALKADGVFDDRPDIALRTINGQCPYTSNGVTYALAGSAAARPSAVRAAPAAPAPAEAAASPTARVVSDEEAERRIDSIEARRKAAPAPAPIASPTPAPAAAAAEKRAEPVPTHDAGAELSSMALRGLDETDGSIDYLFRDPGSRAVERSAPAPDNSASAQLVDLAMRGVNDGTPAADRASRNPSGDLVRLALQDLTDFDGPLDAA